MNAHTRVALDICIIFALLISKIVIIKRLVLISATFIFEFEVLMVLVLSNT